MPRTARLRARKTKAFDPEAVTLDVRRAFIGRWRGVQRNNCSLRRQRGAFLICPHPSAGLVHLLQNRLPRKHEL